MLPLQLDDQYPFVPPKMRFITKVGLQLKGQVCSWNTAACWAANATELHQLLPRSTGGLRWHGGEA